jgi:hypothetical protein
MEKWGYWTGFGGSGFAGGCSWDGCLDAGTVNGLEIIFVELQRQYAPLGGTAAMQGASRLGEGRFV